MAVIATDSQFQVVTCNPAAGELLGVQAADMLGKSILLTIPASRRKMLERLLVRTIERRDASHFELRLPQGARQVRHLLFVLSPVPGEGGSVQGVAAWIVDETNRKKLADRLAQTERLASLGTLASGVAHQFNNILGGISTFVDTAITGGDPAAMKRALLMTSEAVSRAANITQSLLCFADRDHGKSDLADLTEVLLTFAHLVERPLASRKIEFHLDLKPIPIIEVDANRMHQVLGNLLSNAEDAMPNGGTITIMTERADKEVLLKFADTGCGIAPELLNMVFEPFFTTKGLMGNSDKANPGLGLSIVHSAVVDMGGAIEVESTLGQGTQFAIRFPTEQD